MPNVEVRTGERVSTVSKTVSTVTITVNGRIFTCDCKDGVDAMHVAVETARALSVRIGLEP